MSEKIYEGEVHNVEDMERNQRERRAAENDSNSRGPQFSGRYEYRGGGRSGTGEIQGQGAATIWKALAVVIAMLAAVYGASPVDVVPDSIPVAGWLDDIGVLAIAGLNFYQQFAKDQNSPVVKLVKYTKWTMVVLFIIAGLLLGGLIAAIVALVTMALN